jgi:uncharacterized membrane protein YobD (UPF0266 family)
MISRARMKIDITGQIILLLSVLLLLLFASANAWVVVTLIVLALWQTSSAIELSLNYSYRQRYPFVYILPVIIVLTSIFASTPLYWLLGIIGLGLLSYFVATVRDTIIVYRRHRSFWDLQ